MQTDRPRSFEFILDILFPEHCPGCDIVVDKGRCMCSECEKQLEYLEDLPWQSFFEDEINGRKVSFDIATALFYYTGTAAAAVKSFKFRRCLPFADYAAERMAIKLENDITERIDIVTSVPMNLVNRNHRGYDQAELFAVKLADRIGKDYDPTLLGHRFRYISQHKRSAKSRNRSADTTYYIKDASKRLDGKNILICDDIFTTGSTINACSRLLKQMGAERVFAAAICLRAKK